LHKIVYSSHQSELLCFDITLDLKPVMSQQNVYNNSRSERKLPKPSKVPVAQRNSTGRMKPPQSYGFKNKVKPFKHIASNQDINHEINRTFYMK
jgi:hypothetical protein